MKYISTRSSSVKYNFEKIFLKGLADDGGLFTPTTIPVYSEKDLNKFKDLSYSELAIELIFPFVGDTISKNDFSNIIKNSYKKFDDKNVVKISNLGNFKLLELFHGPTLAFKDIAMQFIGNLYEHYLNQNKKKINIIVATSGDTGSAAIDAIKGRKNMNVFVLHPDNKISSVQKKLMTTASEKNVYNLAIQGNFDDCQNIVKSLFADKKFSNSINMSGVNSINWARIIAQSVYYFYSYFKVLPFFKNVNFSVPTGNFGDVFSGYFAKKMGLPINKLIVATNSNDILHRAITRGDYASNPAIETLSPSMDIQIASNFERLIYDLNQGNSLETKKIMDKFKKEKKYIIPKDHLSKINLNFLSESLNEKELISSIRYTYENFKIVLDPHTAIGYGVLNKLNIDSNTIILATAHPSKFPEAIEKSLNIKTKLPAKLNYIMDQKEKYDKLENNTEAVKKFILKKLS